MLPAGCPGHPAVALEGGRPGGGGWQHAVTRNDGAGQGIDWFSVDELVGDFPSPGVHPARAGVYVEEHQTECDMKDSSREEERQKTERWN